VIEHTEPSQTIIPPVVAPLSVDRRWKRGLTPADAFHWLALGWRDFCTRPVPSIIYGLFVFLLSAAIVYGLFKFELDYILFPALAGFMVVGPILAVGPYAKSRQIAGGKSVSLLDMIFVRPAAGAQIMFTGVLLCLLMLVWMRAAVIIYALFFGLVAFPGLDHVAAMLFGTPTGWAMLIVGSIVGALFASFSFAISAFSIPMQLEQRTDALTAMGSSLALVWHNLPAMLTWAAIMLVLMLLSIATGLLGLIVVFPVLGHGTWHAYRAVQPI
jgi:uncharacterized membrane protein